MIEMLLVPWTDCMTGRVEVDVVLRSDEPVWVHSVDMAFGWDPKRLALAGCSFDRSGVTHTLAGIPGLGDLPLLPWDFYGANSDLRDGNAYLMWLAPLTGSANPQMIENEVIATIQFDRIGDSKTVIEILSEMTVDWPLRTVVYAGPVPGVDLLESTVNAKVAKCGDFPFWMIP